MSDTVDSDAVTTEPDTTAPDATERDAALGPCEQSAFARPLFVDARVSLANAADVLRVEPVTTSGPGRICVASQSPTQTTAWADAAPGSTYELRFTADGYVPFTLSFASEVAPSIEPVVMVRGTVLGPVTTDTMLRPEPGVWGVRPGSNDLFFALDGAWRVVRRRSGALVVETIDLPAPSVPGYSSSMAFSPDGALAFLPTAPRGATAITCAAVNAASGAVTERGLSRNFCAQPSFAARASIGLATDDQTAASVVFDWVTGRYRELRRGTGLGLTALDAMGTHALHDDARSHPLIYDIAAGTDAAPTPAADNFARPSRRRYLVPSGTATLHVESGTEGGLVGRACGAGGCALTLETVGAPPRAVVTGAAAWALSRNIPVLAYVASTGELHRFDLRSMADTVISTMAFDPMRTFAVEDAFVLEGASGLQVVDLTRGAIAFTVAGTFMLVPDPRDGVPLVSPFTVARACPGPDCETWVLDLRALRSVRSRGGPYLDGARGWYLRPGEELAAGDATMPVSSWPVFARAGAVVGELTQVGIPGFPCVPYRWRSQWVCAP